MLTRRTNSASTIPSPLAVFVLIIAFGSALAALLIPQLDQPSSTPPADISTEAEQDFRRIFDGVQSLQAFPDPSFPLFNSHGDDIQAAESNSELRALFSEGTDSAVQPFISDSGAAIATIFRLPYDFFAAGMLGEYIAPDSYGDGYANSITEPAFFSVGSPDGLEPSVMFRQGRYLYQITPFPTDIAAEADANRAATHQLALELYDLSPDGDHRPFFFASTLRGVLETAAVAAFVGLAAIGYRKWRAGAATRLAAPLHQARSVDVAPLSKSLRSKNRRTVTLQALALVGGIAITAVAPDPWSLLGGAIVGTAVLAMTYLESNAKGRRVRPKANRSWLLARMTAIIALAIGLGLLVRGLSSWLFTPGLDHTKLTAWLNDAGLPIDVAGTGQAMAAIGVLGLAVGGQLNRQARRLGRPSAEDVRSVDHRPEILYLRSFEDDKIEIPVVTSSRQSVLEFYSALGREPFEDCIAWQLSEHGPVTAINQPGEPADSLGAFREYLPDDQWQRAILKRMERARFIVLTLGSSRGLLWEIERLFERGHGRKCVFAIPPLPNPELRQRWQAVCGTLAKLGAPVDELVDPAGNLVIVFDRAGSPVPITSDRRDEAAYRAAVQSGVRILAS